MQKAAQENSAEVRAMEKTTSRQNEEKPNGNDKKAIAMLPQWSLLRLPLSSYVCWMLVRFVSL